MSTGRFSRERERVYERMAARRRRHLASWLWMWREAGWGDVSLPMPPRPPPHVHLTEGIYPRTYRGGGLLLRRRWRGERVDSADEEQSTVSFSRRIRHGSVVVERDRGGDEDSIMSWRRV